MFKSKLKLAVWICNAVVAVMSVFAIISYFFAPFWRVTVSYTVSGDMMQEMVGDSVDIDTKEIVGEDGLTLGLSLTFKTSVLFKSFGDDTEAVNALIDSNVDLIVDQVTDTLSIVVEKVVRVAASTIVAQQVHENIKEILASINSSVSDEEVTQRLNDIGITTEYISEKTNAIIDSIYGEGSTVDGVCDAIIDTVEDIYTKISQGSDSDLRDSVFTDEQKESIRETMSDVLGNLAAEDGTINADELIASIFLSVLGSDDSDSNNNPDYYEPGYFAAVSPKMAGEGAGEQETQESATVRLKAAVRDFIVDLIPEDLMSMISTVMLAMTLLYIFSSLWWVFILIKLIVKLLKRNTQKVQDNPTVKLKAVIWLGWLPFFILVMAPSIGIKAVMNMMAADMAELGALQISFFSSGLVAAIMAWICFGISIFYIVARKKFKAAAATASATNLTAAPSADATATESATEPAVDATVTEPTADAPAAEPQADEGAKEAAASDGTAN